jgi:site-specific DNA recombinase
MHSPSLLRPCGACGLTITAERKTNRYGDRYTYYHCTHRARACREPSVSEEVLEMQVRAFLASLTIPPHIGGWAAARLEAMRGHELERESEQVSALQKERDGVKASLSELTDLRLRQLVSDEEYLAKRQKLSAQLERLEETIASQVARPDHWIEPAQAVISFSKYAVSWFADASPQEKRLLVSAAGSNPTLKGKILSICAKKPFATVPKNRDILQLCTFVEAIREMSSDSAFRSAIAAIQELEHRFATRDAVEKLASRSSLAAKPSLRRRQLKCAPRNPPDMLPEKRSGRGQ